MDRTRAIEKFKRAARTDFNVLGPAKTVARSMKLITRLRKHGQDWRMICALFNTAMEELGGTQTDAQTLCRLYHLRRKRISRDPREHDLARTPTKPETPATAPPATIATPAPAQPAIANGRPRDGPMAPPVPDPQSDIPSARDILGEARDIKAFKAQSKRNS